MAVQSTRSRRAATIIIAVLIAAAAAAVALPFRALPPPADLRSMTWDAAQHALIGLDMYDHIRRLEPLRLLLRMQAEHWWPPLFGVLSLPAWLAGGRDLSSPSLVSLVSYCLLPMFAWLAVRRVSSRLALLAAALCALFFLRSPQMIEMSTWSMLELAATLFTVAGFCCFLAGPGTRARNWAYGLAGASTLLKYHYGFFLLVTMGTAAFFELDRGERRAFGQLVRSRIRRFALPLSVVAALVLARRIEESRSADPSLPGVPTIVWIACIVALLAALSRRSRVRALWSGIPTGMQRFIGCGLIWPAIVFIDPANLQAWYRQLRVRTDPPATWGVQIREIGRYLTDDYFLGPLLLGAAAAGLIACIVEGARRRRVDVLAVALHAIWPVALMTLSRYRIESRFLATMIGALMLAAILGWTLLLERRRGAAVAAALIAVLVIDQARRNAQWNAMLAPRRVYGYASSDPPHGFVVATVRTFAQGQPVLIVLPRDIEVVAPTIRLGLRIAMPGVGPHEVVVRGGSQRRFAERLRKFGGGLVGVEADPATLHRIAAENGMRVLSVARGPELPQGGRALLIARVAGN